MTEHDTGKRLQQALSLARNLKHGPLPAPEDPMPSPEEALAIINEERRTCGFNWITGERAAEVIRETAKPAKPGVLSVTRFRGHLNGSGSKKEETPCPEEP